MDILVLMMKRRTFNRLLWGSTVASACRMSSVERIEGPTTRVVVIGAGISGLAAARMLTAEGIEVIVLEARDRIGGRMHTLDLAGASIDVGATWIHGATNNPVAELASGLGLRFQPHEYALTRTWDAVEGAEVAPEQLASATLTAEALYDALPGLRETLGPSASLQTGTNAYLASLGLDARAERRASFMLEQTHCEIDYAGPASATSLEVFDEEQWFGADDHLVEGGYGSLIDALGGGLDIRLESVVTEVLHDTKGVAITTASGETFVADRVIVTLPVGVLQAGKVLFAPPLPEAKLAALFRLDMSSLEKVSLRFDERFWPEAGQQAWQLISAERGEFPLILDMSFHAGAPTLVLLHGGQRVLDVLDTKSDAELVTDALAAIEIATGEVPPTPIASSVTRWQTDPYSLGSYTYPALGQSLEDFDTLAEPVDGRVLFAGEGTSSAYFGTVHGALSSGIREAMRLGADPSGLGL